MTPEEYLGGVAWWLRDLPWGMRRKLLAELRDHLAELPEGTDLSERLGKTEQYAADLRAAAGLERRRGPIAFLRARRPRNVILVVLALILVGLAIGAVEWVDRYQPLRTGNSGLDPKGVVSSPAGDGTYVVFREGKPFRYGMTIWNSGRYTVRVLAVPQFELHGLPVAARILLGRTMDVDRAGGIWPPYTAFHPFDLKPGQERAIVFKGVYDEPCSGRGPGSIGWVSMPVRYKFLWRTATVEIPLMEPLAFVFRKSSACR